MTTKICCECNDEWIVGITNTIFDYRDMAIKNFPETCICGYHPWYDAYNENEAIDLKEMNT